ADTVLDPPPGHMVWSADLHLHPDLLPIRRYPQFEDALNRVTADPLTALLTAVSCAKAEQVRGQIQIVIRPASNRHRRRAARILRRLASPFFRTHQRLAHLYLSMALSPSRPLRLLSWPLGRLGRHPHSSTTDAALHTSGSRLH